jgi:FtsH-binding integral membrane protein
MSREIGVDDPFFLKVAKLIPAEVSAAYLAINWYLSDRIDNFLILALCGLVLLITCFFLAKWQSNNKRQAFFTSVAFVLWAANISGQFYASKGERVILACILVLGSIFLPRLVNSGGKENV